MGDLNLSVDDGITEDEEISWEVRRLRLNRLGGPSEIQAEHLRQWLIAETRDDFSDATNCLKVVAIVQAEFRDGTLAEECTWQTVVFIPKGKGDFRGIGLVEVLWKAVAIIFNRRLTAAISFHHTLHGFWARRGDGDRRPRGQAAPIAYNHEGGGPL